MKQITQFFLEGESPTLQELPPVLSPASLYCGIFPRSFLAMLSKYKVSATSVVKADQESSPVSLLSPWSTLILLVTHFILIDMYFLLYSDVWSNESLKV